jgi:hypothetical protein
MRGPVSLLRWTVGEAASMTSQSLSFWAFLWGGLAELVDPGREIPLQPPESPSEGLRERGGGPDTQAVP